MTEIFREQRPLFEAYRDYGERMQALSIEYHRKRLAETFGLVPEEAPIAIELDACQSPKSLDQALQQLGGMTIKRVQFDPIKKRFFLIL